MEKNAFIHYKKTVSWVLCISYVIQLFFWIAIHHCIPQTSDINWVFNVGFWGLNFLLIFAIAFFHLHKKILDTFLGDSCYLLHYQHVVFV